MKKIRRSIVLQVGSFAFVLMLLIGSYITLIGSIIGDSDLEPDCPVNDLLDMDNKNFNSLSIESRGSAESAWPVFMNNVKHTGLSKYNTTNNNGSLKWKYYIGCGTNGMAIGANGIIYVGGGDNYLHAIYPNGTLKWKYGKTYSPISTTPAIATDGTIYVAIPDYYLYAINPNGTLKWKFNTSNYDGFVTSPTIGSDGTIYVCSGDDNLYAISPDGKLLWKFLFGDELHSVPAIDDNGILFIGSYDKNFYAIYSSNGTLKWKKTLNDKIGTSASIGSDGTIYVSTMGNLPNNATLYAFNPNGNQKWKYQLNGSCFSCPSIGLDGTLYLGSAYTNLIAIYPNGTQKWIFIVHQGWSQIAIGSEGSIYTASEKYGGIYAIHPDGKEKWYFSSITGKTKTPCIGAGGTVYFGNRESFGSNQTGYLYAIGGNDTYKNNPPTASVGSEQVVAVNQTVFFNASNSYDIDGDPIKYKWDFGEGSSTDWMESITTSHIYKQSGTYIVILTVSDGFLTDNNTCKIEVLKGMPLADTPWPKHRGNIKNTGLSPYDTSNTTGKLKWSFKTTNDIDSSPVIGYGGTIYIGTNDVGDRNKFYAINPNGTEKWNISTSDGGILSTPVIKKGGTIFISVATSPASQLYAINPNGTIKWSFKLRTGDDGPISSPATSPDGIIYIGTSDGKLFAIDQNGFELWNFTTRGGIDSSPAIDSNGTIYVGSADNKLYAVDPNGTEIWNFTTDHQICSSPAIDNNGTIYIGSGDKKFYAINPDGTKKWSFQTGNLVYSSAAIGQDGTIYFGSMDNKLYAINPNGTERWSFTTGDKIELSSPVIGSEGTVYIGSMDNKIYAINPNGSLKWSFKTGDRIHRSSPAIDSDGTVYIGSRDFNLYAFSNIDTNKQPVSNAGPDQKINISQTVYFDGDKSYDPDNDTLTYNWNFGDGNSTVWQNASNASHLYGVTLDNTGSFQKTHEMVGGTYVGKQTLSSPRTLINGVVTFNGTIIKKGDLLINGSLIVYGKLIVHGSIALTPNGSLTYMVRLTVSDGNLTDHDLCQIMISSSGQHLNRAPVAKIGPNQNVQINQTVFFDASGSYDLDGDKLRYKWSFGDGTSTDWLNQSNTSHIYTQIGKFTVTLTINDSKLSGIDTCVVNVTNITNQTQNRPPVIISIPEKNATVGIEWSYRPIVFDPDDDQITLNVTIKPNGLLFKSGNLTWTPTISQVGNHTVRITASDGHIEIFQEFIILVKNRTQQQNQTPKNITYPIVLAVFPKDLKNLSINKSEIKIIFSKTMNTTSVNNALNISIDVNFSLIWNINETVLTIRFLEDIDYDTNFTIIIDEMAKDILGHHMENPYKIDISTQPKMAGPYEAPDKGDDNFHGNSNYQFVIIIIIVIIILQFIFVIKYRKKIFKKKQEKEDDPVDRQEIQGANISEKIYYPDSLNDGSTDVINELREESLEFEKPSDHNVTKQELLDKIEEKYNNGKITEDTYNLAKVIIMRQE